MSSSEIAKLESRWRENPQGLTFAPLAEAYRKLREPARALEVLADGLARHPDYIPASIVLGRCHLDLGADDKAEAAFLRVLELDDENVIALKALADIAERCERPEEGARRLRALLAVDRTNDEARAQLARLDDAIAAGARDRHDGAVAVPEPSAMPDSGTAAALAPAAEPEPEPELPPADGFEWEEVDLDTVSASAGDGLLLEDHLHLEAEVAPLPDLVLDDRPPISSEAAEAPAMPGLVGRDFREHSASVTPLADLAPGTASVGDEDSELDELEAGATAESDEAISEIERPGDIDLHPAGAGEFQLGSASDDWAASGGSLSGGADYQLPSAAEELVPRDPGDRELELEAVPAPFDADLDADLDVESDGEAAAVSEFDLTPPEELADDEMPEEPEPELVVTESMAELYLRQGHRAEALKVYRQLYLRNRDDLRLRERVDALETALAAEEPAAASAPSFAAPARDRSVASFLAGIFAARPGSAPGPWAGETDAGARSLTPEQESSEPGDAAPTRPAGDHLSLSSVFGDSGSPVPPAMPAASGPAPEDDGISFDAFFGGESPAGAAKSRGGARDDDDLDQFHAWLQNLKR